MNLKYKVIIRDFFFIITCYKIFALCMHTYPQMLEDMRASLQAMDEKRLSSIAEISAKHQKVECILGAVYL